MGTPAIRYASPGIIVDREAAASIFATENSADEPNRGFFARREGPGAFSAPEEAPFPVIALSLAAGPSGGIVALINGGDGETSLRSRGRSGEWSLPAVIPGELYAAPFGLACDSHGAAHAGLGSGGYALQYGRYEDGWTVTALDAKGAAPPPVALSSSGAPEVAYWDRPKAGNAKIYFRSLPGDPELVHEVPVVNPIVTNAAIVLAVGPPESDSPDGRAYLFFSQPVADPTIRKEIVIAKRTGAGSFFVSAPIDQELHKYCGAAAPSPKEGDTCKNQYSEVAPIAILTSLGGDVRFLYVKRIFESTYVGSCMSSEPSSCQWVEQPDSGTYSGDLYMAFMDEDNEVVTTRLTDSLYLSGATAAVDATGKIHVAAYDGHIDGATMPTSMQIVRYLEIGP